MEQKLLSLLAANREDTRYNLAEQLRKAGRKLIGVLDPYVPAEIIEAAGCVSWRVTGAWQGNLTKATIYRPENTCGYCNHVAELLLRDELDFLDGVVLTDRCDDMRRLADLWLWLKKKPTLYYMHVPHKDSEISRRMFIRESRGLIEYLAPLAEQPVSQESLRQAIDNSNKVRRLLRQVYEWRKRDLPPLTGAEMLELTTAATIFPRTQFADHLEELMPYLTERQASIGKVRARLLVMSVMLDYPVFLETIEQVGALVAMDYLETGSRVIWKDCETGSEPLYDLAKYYLSRHSCPRMSTWDKQIIEQLIEWVREFRIDGILNLVSLYCYSHLFRTPYLEERLSQVDIPVISLERQYYLTQAQQLRTRVEAFVELLEANQET